MRNRRRDSTLRQEIARGGAELAALHREMLRPHQMMAASLIERHLGTRGQKRRSSAFYLSWAQGGRTRLKYVPRKDLERVRAQVEAWQAYRARLRRWRQVAHKMVGSGPWSVLTAMYPDSPYGEFRRKTASRGGP